MITLEKPHVTYKDSYLDFIQECQRYNNNTPVSPQNSWWESEGHKNTVELKNDFNSFVNDRLDTKNGSLAKWRENEFIQYWIIRRENPDDAGEFIGYLDIRPTLQSDFAKNNGGHVGVMIRPSAFGKAYPLHVMYEAIKILKQLNINPVLLTCNKDNLPSKRLIEYLMHKFGGTYDGLSNMVYKGKEWNSKRYWITLK